MLGLDTGWNCHISLGNDRVDPTKKSEEQISKNEEITSQKVHSNQTVFNKLGLFKAILLKENLNLQRFKNQKNHLKKKYNKLANSDMYSSLPDIKFNPQGTGTYLDQFQIVRFESSAVQMKKQKACRLRKKRKVKRLNSSCSYYESETSIDSVELDTSKTRLLRRPSKVESIISVKSMRTSLKVINDLQLEDNDDSSSHRTVYSGRTLSETEILGNAVKLPEKTLN